MARRVQYLNGIREGKYGMDSRRQFWIWLVAALGASILLSGVLVWDYRQSQLRWQTIWAGDPQKGSELFFGEKGCGGCHAVNGKGGRLAPDLGFMRSSQPSLSQLVSAMWNCAPRTWERIDAEGVRFPTLSDEEMAHLFAFLYTARYVDEPGDRDRGRMLLAEKGCARCHTLGEQGGDKAPDLSLCTSTSIGWTQALWNHGSEMGARMRLIGMPWPKLGGQDMNDLIAYMAEICRGPRWEPGLLPASPEGGWELFRSKSCIDCHSVNGHGGDVGPELGPAHPLPLSVSQFTAVMWNHSPDMERAMAERQVSRPSFEGRQIADLMVFLTSLRYLEPAGSALVGETVFSRRNCDGCHGPLARGGARGPKLRGNGKVYTTIALSTALWNHGPAMYSRTQKQNVPWPRLAEGDIGNLISFLNNPVEVRR